MRHELRQPVPIADGVYLSEPEVRRRLPEQCEDGVVLRHRPGDLDDVADEERPQAEASARLWFIRIGVRNAAVVADRELAQPLVHPVGRRRPEALRPEAFRSSRKRTLLALELRARGEERAIVVDAVEADLEPAGPQLSEDPLVDRVPVGD